MRLQTGALLLVLFTQNAHLCDSGSQDCAPGMKISTPPPTFPSDTNLLHLPMRASDGSLRKPPRPPRHVTRDTVAQTSPSILMDDYVGSEECVRQKHTHLSCAKAFCPPWTHCVNGTCVCKKSFECVRNFGRKVCGLDGWTYGSLCEALSESCVTGKAIFSHFGDTCSADNVFSISLKTKKQVIELRLPSISKSGLVCAKSWDMAAANVVCRQSTGRGASAAASVPFSEVPTEGTGLPNVCVKVQCTGHEYSLAECNIYGDLKPLTSKDDVATVHCETEDKDSSCEFKCANGRCVKLDNTCDGINHCGDRSDEMCCKGCRHYGSHCQSNVCIPSHAVGDGIRDCLGGDDELITVNLPTEPVISAPKEEIKALRDALEVLECGLPNPSATTDSNWRVRGKRIVGGVPTEPTQIPWQVAIQERGQTVCGGVYLGGCWVLTAAHCVRHKPEVYKLKFSLGHRRRLQPTTDVDALERVLVHPDFNASTHINNIALLQLSKPRGSFECAPSRNPAIRPICVPWSSQQFQPGHNCSISGWGNTEYGRLPNVLHWANVMLLDNCESHHQESLHEGKICAGDVEGSVDYCQGDSGGPLVCKDVSGVSYVWGVMGYHERCGQKGLQGLYTPVASYFEWIQATTENSISKYNQ